MFHKRFRSIATQLVSRIVLLALIGMSLFVGLLAAWEYESGKRSFKADMERHADSSLLLLSSALWDIDPTMVGKQVQWLGALPQVGHVRVRATTTGEIFEAGAPPSADRPAALKVDIPAPQTAKAAASIPLGTLEIWESRRYYFELIRNSILGVVLGYGLFTAMVCAVVMVVMRRQLQAPLRQIARFASDLKPNGLPQALVLDRPQRTYVDEIDLVARGFVQLQSDLQGHIAHLDRLVAERTAQLERMVEEVKSLSLTDALTGCLNRRALDERLHVEVKRCQRYARTLSVVFMDLDHFKRINDEYGHATGDAVLRELAWRCQRELKTQVDWLARYGGEEFLIVLPESEAAEAHQLALRLGWVIRSQSIDVDSLSLYVTASFGIAQLQEGEAMDSFLQRADAALYEAKAAGRDCVRFSDAQAGRQEKAPQA
jgi:diguanylate cyclase (GGDEF)-like protein